MAHIRTQIRNALSTRLTGLTTTGARVFNNRLEPLQFTELPALLVMNDSEIINGRSFGSQLAPHARRELRTISYKVRAVVKANAAIEDTLDQICLETEKAIGSDIFMGGLTVDARLISTVYEKDESSDKVEAIADMIFEFDTWVLNTTPDVVVA